MLNSCGDDVQVVGDDSDIQIPLPDQFSYIFYRDAINLNYKISIFSKELYDFNYYYGIYNEALVDGTEITIKMVEVRGYENKSWDGFTKKSAEAFINLGFMEKSDYTFNVNHPIHGEFKSKLSLKSDHLLVEVTQPNSFIELPYQKVDFLPDNYFWGVITFKKSTDFSFEDYKATLINAGAQFVPLPEGYYSYFITNAGGSIQNAMSETNETVSYTYYFYYPSILEYTKIKTAIYSYVSKAASIANYNYDGEVFPIQ